MINTVVSYDNTIIRPVVSMNYAELPTPIDNTSTTTAPFKVLAVDDDYSAFAPLLYGWKVVTNRTAFEYGVLSLTNQATSDGAYIEMFEFTFRLQSGKTEADIADAFALEDGSTTGNFIQQFHPAGDFAGLLLRDTAGVLYTWGSTNKFDAGERIGEVTFLETTVWSQDDMCTVYYIVDDVTYARLDVANGGYASLPSNPKKEGYVFVAWLVGSPSGARFNTATAITTDTHVYASWRVVIDYPICIKIAKHLG